MGFRNGSYCTVWTVEPKTDAITKGRISISKKNKNTGEYVTDFSGFVSFIGSITAQKALKLKEGSRIKLGDVEVTNKYDKEKQITYTNFNIFSFDELEDSSKSTPKPDNENVSDFVDVEEDSENGLPF